MIARAAIAGVHINQDLIRILCKNRGIYGFLRPSWVLITVALRNTVLATRQQLCSMMSFNVDHP